MELVHARAEHQAVAQRAAREAAETEKRHVAATAALELQLRTANSGMHTAQTALSAATAHVAELAEEVSRLTQSLTEVEATAAAHVCAVLPIPYVFFIWHGPKACANRTGAVASVARRRGEPNRAISPE